MRISVTIPSLRANTLRRNLGCSSPRPSTSKSAGTKTSCRKTAAARPSATAAVLGSRRAATNQRTFRSRLSSLKNGKLSCSSVVAQRQFGAWLHTAAILCRHVSSSRSPPKRLDDKLHRTARDRPSRESASGAVGSGMIATERACDASRQACSGRAIWGGSWSPSPSFQNGSPVSTTAWARSSSCRTTLARGSTVSRPLTARIRNRRPRRTATLRRS